ncbi:MAG: ATP-binding cassette domain-containing protein [Verrucomicrobia bacterium]|nr:MAG: ATP-binding cassette domain-containing protein [Verrucomicrobiota bacterium]
MNQTTQPATAPQRAVWLRLFSYAKPYWRRLLLGIFFGILFGGSTTGLLPAIQKNFSNFFEHQDLPWNLLIGVAVLLPILAALRGLGDFASRYLIEWVGKRVVRDIREKLFDHTLTLSMGYFTRSRSGELMSRITNDTMMIENAVSTFIGDLIREPFVLIGGVGYILWLNWKLALISLVLFPVCILPVAYFGRKVRRAAREGQARLANLAAILQEALVGMRIVKAFGMENYERQRFSEEAKATFSRAMKVTRANASIEPIIVFLSTLGLALVMFYKQWTHMSGADLFTFALAMLIMYQPVKKLSKLHLAIQQSSAAADRIFELLDTAASVTDRPNAITFNEPVHRIAFEQVGFAYDAHEQVLQNINLTVGAGQCYAFVGSSGAGKSTLVSLVPRFYDVTAGRILLNDHDLRDLTQESLRRQIGMVTQDTILFNDTVANNIAYGTANADRAAIIAAAKRAHAHDFIMEMKEDYDTHIGERGVRLSGGQRQRLAIARAILRNPPILILDEATSALDTESERAVQAALDELMAHRTVLAIAHRLSTIMHADQIVVLENGRIVETGTHQELLTRGGVYKRLYDLQFRDTPEPVVK